MELVKLGFQLVQHPSPYLTHPCCYLDWTSLIILTALTNWRNIGQLYTPKRTLHCKIKKIIPNSGVHYKPPSYVIAVYFCHYSDLNPWNRQFTRELILIFADIQHARKLQILQEHVAVTCVPQQKFVKWIVVHRNVWMITAKVMFVRKTLIDSCFQNRSNLNEIYTFVLF